MHRLFGLPPSRQWSRAASCFKSRPLRSGQSRMPCFLKLSNSHQAQQFAQFAARSVNNRGSLEGKVMSNKVIAVHAVIGCSFWDSFWLTDSCSVNINVCKCPISIQKLVSYVGCVRLHPPTPWWGGNTSESVISGGCQIRGQGAYFKNRKNRHLAWLALSEEKAVLKMIKMICLITPLQFHSSIEKYPTYPGPSIVKAPLQDIQSASTRSYTGGSDFHLFIRSSSHSHLRSHADGAASGPKWGPVSCHRPSESCTSPLHWRWLGIQFLCPCLSFGWLACASCASVS